MEPGKAPIRSPHGRNRSRRRMSHTNLTTDTSQALNSHESSQGNSQGTMGFSIDFQNSYTIIFLLDSLN